MLLSLVGLSAGCPATCYQTMSCDDIISMDATTTCAYLQSAMSCDCTGCSCGVVGGGGGGEAGDDVDADGKGDGADEDAKGGGVEPPRPPPQPPLPPLPPPSPPMPPLSPGYRSVVTTTELIAAVRDTAVNGISLAAGTYLFDTQEMCTDGITECSDGQYCDTASVLCVQRNLTLVAAEPGTVVLDANWRRGSAFPVHNQQNTQTSKRLLWVNAPDQAPSRVVVEIVGIVLTGGFARGYGGAVMASGFSSLVITGGSVLRDNFAQFGGGAAARSGAYITVAGQSAVSDNYASSGGGLYATSAVPGRESNLLITGRSEVCRNAVWFGYGAGGGIRAVGAHVTIDGQSTVCENTAASEGGGLSLIRQLPSADVQNIPSAPSANATITGQSSVRGNRANHAGGIHLEYGTHLVLNGQSSISSNTAVAAVGGLEFSGGGSFSGGVPDSLVPEVTLSEASTVRNNSAASDGGALLNGVCLHIDGAIFEANRASASSTALIALPMACSSPVRNLTVLAHGTAISTIVVTQAISWVCPLGQWSPTTGIITGDISTGDCPYTCNDGFFGNSSNLATAECTGPCPPGFVCPAGSITPTPCPAGSYLDSFLGRSLGNCIRCSPGSFSAINGSAGCTACAAGTLSEVAGASSCNACPVGGFCASDGAASLRQTFEPCAAGTFNPSVGALSNASCVRCAIGKANPIPGSADPEACRDCLAGSFAATVGTGICSQCASGTYQAQRGATSCEVCPRGSYCIDGSSTPQACPGGTWSNASGMSSVRDCLSVAPGFWSPIGSATPVTCPSSGFTCPGRRADTVNDPPGSLPVQLTVGSISQTTSVVREVPQLQTTLTLDAEVDNVDLDQLRSRLAALYGVPEADIQLSLGGGSVVVTVGIAAASSSIDDLNATIAARSDEELSQALGVNTSRAAATTLGRINATVIAILQSVCPAGSWCSAGYTFPCLTGRYNPYSGADNASACIECPGDSTTTEAGCTSISQCRCNPTFFDAADADAGRPDCQPCPVGTICDRIGHTLRSLQVQPGYFRRHELSVDVQRCSDAAVGCSTTAICAESRSGCRGGDDVNNSCAPSLSGIYCQKCEEVGSVYHAATISQNATCVACAGAGGAATMLSRNVLIYTLITLGFIGSLCVFGQLRRRLVTSRFVRNFERFWSTCRPEAKVKIVLGFYMIVARVESVYDAPLPLDVRNLLRFFSFGISFGMHSFDQVLACIRLDGYVNRLAFTMVLPVALVLLIVAVCALYSARKGKLSRTSLVKTALPALLRMWFFFYPQIVNTAFEAFACHQFDTEEPDRMRAFLVADVAIECNTPLRVSPEHDAVRSVAWGAVSIYAVGTMLLTAALLLAARRDIQALKHTLLSDATVFLWREYEPDFFWWDLMEMFRRFVLVGVMVQVERGTIMQLAFGAFYSLAHLMLQVQCMPFKDTTDDYLSNACTLLQTIFFLCLMIAKVATLSDYPELIRRMSNEQRYDFVVPIVPLGFALFGCVVGVLALSAGMLVITISRDTARQQREARASKAKRLRNDSGSEVVAPQVPAGHYHTFLSHVWGTGQDQMRIVKNRLQEMMPDLSVFLDVDDLEEIGDLEGYIDRTVTVLVYCSDGYFRSKNCMRELVASTMKAKPIIALIDPDASRGGLSLEQVRERLVSAESRYGAWGFDAATTPSGSALYDHLFAREPIEWNRLGVFQAVTMRLIAERLLLPVGHGDENDTQTVLPSPHGQSSSSRAQSSAAICSSTSAPQSAPRQPQSTSQALGGLFTPRTPRPTERYYVDGEIVSIRLGALPPPVQPGAAYHLYCSAHNLGAIELMEEASRERGFRLVNAPFHHGEPAANVLYVTSDPTQLSTCDHALLYLTSQTWTRGEASAALAAELSQAMECGVHVMLAHEMPGVGGQEARHGCEFGSFFACDEGATPQELLQRGIYSEIAVALKGGPWREASMVLLGQALGMPREDSKVTTAIKSADVAAADELVSWSAHLGRAVTHTRRRMRQGSGSLGGALKARCGPSASQRVAPSARSSRGRTEARSDGLETSLSVTPAPEPLAAESATGQDMHCARIGDSAASGSEQPPAPAAAHR